MRKQLLRKTPSQKHAVFRHGFTVSNDAVDQNGHVNNVVYVQWMQDIAVLHSEIVGGTQAMRDAGGTWVVRAHKVEYIRPAFNGDHVEVLTWVVNFRGARSVRRYKFVRALDNTVLAKGETEWVFIDVRTGRPRIIPDDVLGAFEVVPEDQEP